MTGWNMPDGCSENDIPGWNDPDRSDEYDAWMTKVEIEITRATEGRATLADFLHHDYESDFAMDLTPAVSVKRMLEQFDYNTEEEE